MPSQLYLVIPDPDGFTPGNHPYDSLTWAASFDDAVSLAEAFSRDECRSYMVFEWALSTGCPTPVPLEQEYGVVPGRDFPATL